MIKNKKYIISWGGGVNSTAIIALHLLGKFGNYKPEIIFADTGCEMPNTYPYIAEVGNICVEKGFKVTVLRPSTHPEVYSKRAKRNETLLDLLVESKTVPSFRWRLCNSEYKRDPMKRYTKGKEVMVGICKDEKHRAKNNNHIYPIIEYTRKECEDLIKRAGLPKAHKTGCFLCPLQGKKQWIDMYYNYPELWEQCINLEKLSQKEGRKITFIQGFTLEKKLAYWIEKELLKEDADGRAEKSG